MARSIRRGSGSAGGLLRVVERSGMRKGMAGSKTWFYVGTGLWTLRTVRRLAARNEELLISEELKPGQRIIIANGRASIEDGPAPVLSSRKERASQRKADAKSAKRSVRRAKRSGRSAEA